MLIQKHNAEHAWRIRTLASSTARAGKFLRDDTTENKKYIKSVLFFSIPNFYIRKGRPHGHRYGKKGCKEYHTANNFRRGVERNNTKTFTIDLSVTRRSERR